MRSFCLDAALVGAVALGRVRRPAFPAMPALPGLPALPSLSDLVGHARFRFVRRASGVFVPATPALIGAASPAKRSASGPVRHRSWSDAIDLEGMLVFLEVTHGRRKVAEAVAARLGEPVTTVRKWFGRETRPSFRATMLLVCEYGPPLLEAGLKRHPDWLAAQRAGTDRLVLAGEMAALRARLNLALGDGWLGQLGGGLA